MKNLIGRKYEISLLEEYVNSQMPQFVAIYGRRRIGKTFLVNSLFKNRLSFSMTGVMDGSFNDQITAFMDGLSDYGYIADEKPKTWMDAFVMLKNFLKMKKSDEPIIIFIDELPCLDTQRSGFTNALGYFWNSWASLQDNLTLIVCGSATSWMINNIIDNKGGLHNRITHEIHLKPFTLHESEQLLLSRGFEWSREMILNAYMALGGIPFYLEQLRRDESFAQNIDRLFFSQDSSLRREYKRLYSTLFNSPDKYCDIIRVMVRNKSGLTRTEIANLLGKQSSGKLSSMLEDLEHCDIIRKYNVRDKKVKTTSAIYQIVDMFSLFYITFNTRAEIEYDYWKNHLDTAEVNSWLGLSFEKVCLLHTQQIKKALKIDGISTKSYAWRSKTSTPQAQVDLLIERADNIINLCEIKYSGDKFSISKAENDKMQIRKSTFKEETQWPGAVWLTMITTYGLANSMYNDKVARLVTMDDLFAE